MGMDLSDLHALRHSYELHSCASSSHPNPARRLTTEQALSHTWLTSFVASTGYDLCGLLENFDPHARWRNTIGAARAMSRFAKGNGANNNTKDHRLALSSDDEDDKGSRRWSPSLRVTPKPDSKRQPQHLLPPSAMVARHRAGWRGLQRRCRHHHHPQCHFLMPSARPRLLMRPKRRGKGKQLPVHGPRRWHPSCAIRRG